MNIGLFSDSYFPQISGVTAIVDTLEKELIKMGHNVYIFAAGYPGYVDENKNIFRLPSIPFLFDKSCRVGSFYSIEIMNKIKDLHLDVIHSHTEFSIGIFGRIVAKQLKIPLVHTYHTMYEDWIYYTFNKNVFSSLVAKNIINVTKSHCNACYKIIAPSSKIKEFLESNGVKKPIAIVSNGIDLSRFDDVNKKYNLQEIQKLKKELGFNSDDKIVLNLGRQSKEKSVDVIIRSMQNLIKKQSNVKLAIVGDGPNRVNLEQLVSNLKLKDYVIFLGKKPKNNIEKYYKIADLFVMASLFEVQPLTVIESMAAKIPVVVKRDKAFYELVENNVTGFYFDHDEELPDLLFTLLNKDLEDIKNNAFNKVQGFSSLSFSKNVENIYLDVINKNNC